MKNNRPPHIIFDTTITNVASETVKSLSAALGIPTVSASFGQEGDLRQWRDLDEKKRQYLLQVMPPTDIIPEVIRSIITHMNITNAAILYDESFGKSRISVYAYFGNGVFVYFGYQFECLPFDSQLKTIISNSLQFELFWSSIARIRKSRAKRKYYVNK